MDEDLDIIQAQCRYCLSKDAFKYIYCHKHESRDGCPEEYSLAVCKACNEVSLFFREEPDFIWETFEDIAAFQYLWPVESRELSFELPSSVSQPYFEAVNASKAGLYIAAGAMIGRALEAMCKDFNPSCNGIFSGLKAMLKDGVLSKELFDWANELRVLRNESAHDSGLTPTNLEVESALDFLQSILKVVYEIRPKFCEYTNFRASNKK